MAAYDLRTKERRNYNESKMAMIPRSRRSRAKKDDTLYELEIVEEDHYNAKVKVHYTGYGSEDDEWRDKDDIVQFKPQIGKVPCCLHPYFVSLLHTPIHD